MEVVDLIRLTDRLAKPLWPNIVQLFSCEGRSDSKPSPVGCGVLVRHEDRILVFTAAHVLAEFKNKRPWVEAGEELVLLPGEYHCQFSGSPEMGNHQRDRLDAAVCLLPPDIPAEFKGRAIEIETSASFTPTQETLYLLLGHPANRTNVDRVGKDILSERMPLAFPEVPAPFYARTEYSRDTHLLLKWRKQWKTPTGTRHARNLKGSSGGGIWAFDPCSDTTPQLVATFTEVPPIKGGKVYVGTRLDAHIYLMSQLLRTNRP